MPLASFQLLRRFVGESCSPADTPVCLFAWSRAFGRFRCLAGVNRIRLCTTRKVWSFGVFVSEGGLPLCWWEQKPPPPFSIWVLFPQFFWVLSGGFPTPAPYWALSSKLKGDSACSPEHSLCAALSSPSCALLTLAAFGLPSIQLHLLGPAPLPGCSLQVVTWGSPRARLVSSCLSGVTVLLYLTCSVSNTIASPTLSRLLVISYGGYTQPLSIHCGVKGSFQPRTTTL